MEENGIDEKFDECTNTLTGNELLLSGYDSLWTSGESSPEPSNLRGLATCKVTKLLGDDNLSEQIASTLKRCTRAVPQTNRETLLEAVLTTNDEDHYCRIPFLEILNLIISFAVDKKLARNSPRTEGLEYEEDDNEGYLDDVVKIRYRNETSSPASEAGAENPPSSSSEDILDERALFIGEHETDSEEPKDEDYDTSSQNIQVKTPVKISVSSWKPVFYIPKVHTSSGPAVMNNGKTTNNQRKKHEKKVLRCENSPVYGRYLTVPQPVCPRNQVSPDNFRLSPVLAKGRTQSTSPACCKGSAAAPNVGCSTQVWQHSTPKHHHCCKSPSCGNRLTHGGSHFVISPVVELKKPVRYKEHFGDCPLLISPRLLSDNQNNLSLDSSCHILNRIPYKYDKMVLAWCPKGIPPNKISQLLYGPSEPSMVQYKNVSIVAWDEDTYIPPGFVLKFSSPSEAVRAHRELTYKYRNYAQTLSMGDLMKAVVKIEVAHLPVRPSTVVLRSRKRQDQPPDTQELESCLRKYGDVRQVQYIRREAGAELICEAKYNCVTQGFLAVVALDDSYLTSVGGLCVKFKRSGANEILVPKITDYIQKCLKNT